MTRGPGTGGEDAAALDRSLDDLIDDGPDGRTPLARGADGAIDPAVAHAARVVAVALARFHPSFRFEERLAARLRVMAQGDDPDPVVGREATGVLIPFLPAGTHHRGRSRRVNGALIGGAISAGVSLASIAAGALVARRRARGEAPWERLS